MLKDKKIPVVNISRCHSSTFESRQSLFKQSYVGEQRSFPREHCEQSSLWTDYVNAADLELFTYRRLPAPSCFNFWNFLFLSSSSLGDLKNISILVVQAYPSCLCWKAESFLHVNA